MDVSVDDSSYSVRSCTLALDVVGTSCHVCLLMHGRAASTVVGPSCPSPERAVALSWATRVGKTAGRSGDRAPKRSMRWHGKSSTVGPAVAKYACGAYGMVARMAKRDAAVRVE